MRLDSWIAKNHSDITRSQAKKLIINGNVLVNKKICDKASYLINTHDKITIKNKQLPPQKITPENIPLDIVYEDKYIAAINKPAGLVVHPAAGNRTGTLVNALMYHFKKLSNKYSKERLGIIHRLDKDTSGIVLIAKTNQAHAEMSKLFKERKVKKTYYALVKGNVKNDEGTIDKPIGRDPRNRKKMKAITNTKYKSRTAITNYKVVKRYNSATLLKINPITGRTHQIRVHLAYIGHPIIGDLIYNPKTSNKGLHLHAKSISFTHPILKKRVNITVPNQEWYK
ncbi:RluA family pseudouridine synthase [Candidatus Margulisiibacteriota bacterium]